MSHFSRENESGSVDRAALREGAMRLLARREHSQRELIHKLVKRDWPVADVESVVEELAAENLQSDERFAEGFVRQRAGKAYGPVRIRAELAERGIDRAQITRALEVESPDWLAIASDWYDKRYGCEQPADLKEKSRRQQALARRGFGHDVVRQLTD